VCKEFWSDSSDVAELLEVPTRETFVPEADADVKEESALGRLASGVIVVRRVSHASFAWSSSRSTLL
jgi:hypothetical protein